MACQHFPDDQTLRLQAGAGEDDVIHLPSGLDRVDCERQEEEEEVDGLFEEICIDYHVGISLIFSHLAFRPLVLQDFTVIQRYVGRSMAIVVRSVVSKTVRHGCDVKAVSSQASSHNKSTTDSCHPATLVEQGNSGNVE